MIEQMSDAELEAVAGGRSRQFVGNFSAQSNRADVDQSISVGGGGGTTTVTNSTFSQSSTVSQSNSNNQSFTNSGTIEQEA
jgi:hypothetical protein